MINPDTTYEQLCQAFPANLNSSNKANVLYPKASENPI